MPYLILPQTNLLLTLIGSLDLSQPQYLSLKTRIKFPISGAHEKHFQSLIVAMYLTTIHSSNFKIFFSSYFQTSQAQTQNSNPFKHTAFRILHNQAAPQTSQTYVPPPEYTFGTSHAKLLTAHLPWLLHFCPRCSLYQHALCPPIQGDLSL